MTRKTKNENWLTLSGFSNYEISDRGRIRSKTRKIIQKGSDVQVKLKGKLLRQRWNKACKCYFLDLKNDEGKRKTVYPHRETAKHFVLNDDEKKIMVIHVDNNPKNNDASNLKWMTRSEHMKWQFEVGNKDNKKSWKTRKKKYVNGFKPETVLPGRPPKKLVAET